ncbi:phosphatase PAP2 family protein [Candidatus Uhrbacteria bacterium]|nr:phosphatase PAP2 family protein [Candidatus Uhrbacteria bacterium]
MNIDHKFSHAFFNKTRQHWLSRHIAVAASTHLIWLMIGVLVTVTAWNSETIVFVPGADTLFVLALLLPAWGVTGIISKLVNRKRPYLETKQKPLIDPFVHTASFPSAHATFAFTIISLSFLFYTALLPYMLAAGIVVALGRVATGVHFFSDILAGAFIGLLVTPYATVGVIMILERL